MYSSRNDLDLWRPRCFQQRDPYAAFVIATGPQGLWGKWWGHLDEAHAALLQHFLMVRLQTLLQIELDAEANFLCAVFRRAGRVGEVIEEIGADTAIAEYGHGRPPASPEGWPLVDVRTLLQAAIQMLSGFLFGDPTEGRHWRGPISERARAPSASEGRGCSERGLGQVQSFDSRPTDPATRIAW